MNLCIALFMAVSFLSEYFMSILFLSVTWLFLFSSNQPTMWTCLCFTIYWLHSSVYFLLFYLSCLYDCLYYCLFCLSCLYFVIFLLSWIYRGCQQLAAINYPQLLTDESNISTTTNPPNSVNILKHARTVKKHNAVPLSEKWIKEETGNFVNAVDDRNEESDGGICSCCYISWSK